jgi:hypothetical protein
VQPLHRIATFEIGESAFEIGVLIERIPDVYGIKKPKAAQSGAKAFFVKGLDRPDTPKKR